MNLSLKERIEKKKAENLEYGDFCIHGEWTKKCRLHSDELTERVSNLVEVIMEDFHDMDYDDCSFDSNGIIEMIKQFVSGEDVETG